MTGSSRVHHYVPKGLLRHFCFQGTQLWYFSQRTPELGILERNIRSVFHKPHLNSYVSPSGRRNDRLEAHFATSYDSQIAPLAREVEGAIHSGRHILLTPDHREFLTRHVHAAWRRSPESFPEERAEATTAEILRDIDPEARPGLVRNAMVVVRGSEAFSSIAYLLNGFAPVFGVPARAKKEFVVSSLPVARLGGNGTFSLRDDGAQLWTPLGPRLALGLVRAEVPGTVWRLADDAVRRVNLELIHGREAFAARSRALIASLLEAR